MVLTIRVRPPQRPCSCYNAVSADGNCDDLWPRGNASNYLISTKLCRVSFDIRRPILKARCAADVACPVDYDYKPGISDGVISPSTKRTLQTRIRLLTTVPLIGERSVNKHRPVRHPRLCRGTSGRNRGRIHCCEREWEKVAQVFQLSPDANLSYLVSMESKLSTYRE